MPGWPARSTTSSFVGSTAIPPAPGGWSSIRELVEELFAGEDAWIVGGAVRDAALERPIVDVDVALAEPQRAARRYARASGGAPFPLSERRLRAIGESVFRDDPLRLLRGPRLEDELPFDFRLVPETEQLIRRDSGLVTNPSKERILGELRRLSADGFRRLDELGLLEPLGGSLA